MVDLQLSMPGSLGPGRHETHDMQVLRDAEILLSNALMVGIVLPK